MEEKRIKRKLIWSGIAGIIVLLALLNGTRLFYFESEKYPVNDLSEIMDKKALPIEIKQGSKKAVICIHGYPATPAGFIYQAEQFSRKGYDVYAPLLPGFGTRVENMQGSTFRTWYAYLRDYYTALRRSYDKVYIVGMSMGGSMALGLAEEFSEDPALAPDAIATVSAPVFLNSLIENGVVLSPLLYISRTLSWIMPHPVPGEDTVTGLPDGGDRWTGYHALMVPQVHSFKMGLKPIKRNLSRVTVPWIGMQAKGDKDVHFKNLNYIYHNISSQVKEKKVFDLGDTEHTHHVLVMYDSTREEVFQTLYSFFTDTVK